MKEITCPYAADCGQTFTANELSKRDREFLRYASDKKMTFMFIYCPKCARRIQFDATLWKASASEGFNNSARSPKKQKTPKQLLSRLKKLKIDIPIAYLDYLLSDKFRDRISIFKDKSDFCLYSLEELCEIINIDGVKYYRIRELKGYANALKGLSWSDKNFALSELAECLSIGYENEKVLFIDNSDNSALYIFHIDGGDIEKTDIMLKDIYDCNQRSLKNAKPPR
ncbi:MAG: hypothetical protein LBQ52_01615 [Helicobacteraceae bacterium]|jgi:hypothetical protein|nr:hypothetical protein [Helicobacteraceae bacterium]